MIRLGSFVFPQGSTEVQSRTVEAKSRVRKEIRIQSVISEQPGQGVDEQIGLLQRNLERFDRNDERLSIHPGRFHEGRQRHYQCHPSPDDKLAWLDLTFLTADRMERSERLHACTAEIETGIVQISMVNQGNWDAPTRIEITANDPLQSIRFQTGYDPATLTLDLSADERLIVDGMQRTITQDAQNRYETLDGPFPTLQPGYNTWLVSVEPTAADVSIRIEYHDVWI